MKNIELRVKQMELRSNKNGTMAVSGYVNKTEAFSEVMGVTKRFVEKISRGAFARSIQNATRDIDFLAEHNSKLILSSTRNNSLRLEEDDAGLYMTATITPTSWGKDYYELINSGIHRNMSFGFRTIKDSWRKLEAGLYERTIEELELFEVSVVRDPAYSQSTIAARGIDLVTEVDIPVSTIKNKEQNNMKTVHTYGQSNKNEQRNIEVEQFKNYVEERDLQGTQPAAALMGEKVYDGVVKKMEEISPIFGRARKFPSVDGTLKIPRETALADEAAFVGEGNSVKELEIGLEQITLGQKRVGASIRISNQLILDAAVDTVGYVQDMLARKTVAAVEKSMLTGSTADEFRGIVHDATVPNFNLETAATDNQKLDKLLEIYLSVHSSYHGGACYIMSRSFFNDIAKLKDGNNHFYIQNGFVNGKPTKTLFGAGVLVSQSLEAGTVPCIFGNIEQSYAIMVKQGPNLQKIVDTENALKGVTGFVFDSYLDGQVYNPQAIAKLTTV